MNTQEKQELFALVSSVTIVLTIVFVLTVYTNGLVRAAETIGIVLAILAGAGLLITTTTKISEKIFK
jgi:hypothetical protein